MNSSSRAIYFAYCFPLYPFEICANTTFAILLFKLNCLISICIISETSQADTNRLTSPPYSLLAFALTLCTNPSGTTIPLRISPRKGLTDRFLLVNDNLSRCRTSPSAVLQPKPQMSKTISFQNLFKFSIPFFSIGKRIDRLFASYLEVLHLTGLRLVR